MKIQIISTGSQGNAILFCGSVLIDVGVAYKYLNEYAQQIKAVLLTHIHGDHFNPSSIRKLYVENEDIKFCCGDFLEQSLIDLGMTEDRIIVINQGEKYKIDDVVFSPIFLQHDTPNFGYRIMQNGEKHIHATDTANLDGITAKDYDSATIEANHDLPEALKIMEDKNREGEFCHLKRAIKTHLSVDKAIKFINDNNIKKWIPVHIGSATKAHVMDKIEVNQHKNINQQEKQMTTEERVKKILMDHLGLRAAPKDSNLIVDSLGADSLDEIEIIMALEEEFDLEISDNEAEQIKTVGDAVRYIENSLKDR